MISLGERDLILSLGERERHLILSLGERVLILSLSLGERDLIISLGERVLILSLGDLCLGGDLTDLLELEYVLSTHSSLCLRRFLGGDLELA